MLEIRAAGFVEMGAHFETIRSELSRMPAIRRASPVDGLTWQGLGKRLLEMDETCVGLQLPVTRRLVQQIIEDLAKGESAPSFEYIGRNWEYIERAYRAELDSRLFMLILPHRSTFWSDQESNEYGAEVAQLIELLRLSYPDAIYDAIEAGNCFSCERFTACVYHLMRVAEYGLIATADSLGLPENKRRSWDLLIGGIYSEVKRRESTQEPNWEHDRKKYNDLCAWFSSIKAGWRNPVSHTPRIYAEPTARGLFPTILALFEHLKSYGIRQGAMPTEAIAPPGQ